MIGLDTLDSVPLVVDGIDWFLESGYEILEESIAYAARPVARPYYSYAAGIEDFVK